MFRKVGFKNGGSRPNPIAALRRFSVLRSCLAPGVATWLAVATFVVQAPGVVSAAGVGCANPGVDGPPASPLTGIVNSYYPATASAAAGATSISIGPPLAGAPAPIAPGDLLLVIQMQDADIQSTNAITYGDGATGRGSTNLHSTGLYEYAVATSAAGATVSIAGTGGGGGLVNSYDFSAVVAAPHGVRTFQVIRVPQYSSATVGANLTAAAWNGTLHAGGVLAMDVAGALNLNGQTISVDQRGFKGGLGVQQNGPLNGATGTDYVVPSLNGNQGYKGEGISGTPRFLYDAIAGAAVTTGAADGYPAGDAARGAPGNAGGGGTDSNPAINDQNAGGGGGANGGQGGMGGNAWFSMATTGGLGGAAFPATAAKVVLGGGGGAGDRNNSAAFQSSGGTGGGIVMIRTGSLAGVGTITANGGVGVTPANDGGGGGGAGGSIIVTTNTGTVNGVTITANGGRGTDAWPAGGAGTANRHGPGGGGAGGVIVTSNALPPAQTSVAGGAHGITTNGPGDPYGSSDGAAGLILTTTLGAIPGSSSGAQCLPLLTTLKSTSTPVVVNSPSGTTATYTITTSNAAGVAPATGVSISDNLPAGFSYASTGAIVLNGGATRTAVVNPVAGATSPAFGTFSIPAGGSVDITFTVNIASSVVVGTYSNPATATYLDPARTTPTGTTTSGYPGGGGERVTVTAPDMTIAKSHVDPFLRGTTSTYTLTATNSGNAPTSGTVTVTDTLPVGLTPTAAAGAGWTCLAPAGQNVSCNRADTLAAGASYPVITVTVNVLQSAPSSVTNQATVGGGGEINTTNDTATDPTNIVTGADIAVTKAVNNATPVQGSNVTFTIVATNNGPSTATGVLVTDALPAGLTFVSATPSGTTTYAQGSGLWTIGTLAVGARATLSIVATVTTTTSVVNTATKTAENEFDPAPGNNSGSATVTGVPNLPNTSAPLSARGAAGSGPPGGPSVAWLAALIVVAGIGALVLAAVGMLRSGLRLQHGQRQLAFAMLATLVCLALGPPRISQLAMHRTDQTPSLSAAAGQPIALLGQPPPAVEMIGGTAVTTAVPDPPADETFHAAAGPITPARLRIPAIGVDAEVDGVGVLPDGSMAVPDNLWTSSWLSSGPRPGEAGSAVIAGHRGVGTPALFSNLEAVEPGDRVYVSDATGGQLIYVVTRVASLDLSAPSAVKVFGPTPAQQLVLITCFGKYLVKPRTYDHRLVVFSRLLPPSP